MLNIDAEKNNEKNTRDVKLPPSLSKVPTMNIAMFDKLPGRETLHDNDLKIQPEPADAYCKVR